MKKLIAPLILFFLLPFSTYAVGQAEAEQSKEKAGFIISFFSTELLINFIFAVIAVVLTIVIAKLVRNRIGGYLETSIGSDGEGREELVSLITRTLNIGILLI